MPVQKSFISGTGQLNKVVQPGAQPFHGKLSVRRTKLRASLTYQKLENSSELHHEQVLNLGQERKQLTVARPVRLLLLPVYKLVLRS